MDDQNGAKILLGEIEVALENKKLTVQKRLELRIHKYTLENTIIMRRDIRALKKHDVIQWVSDNPKTAGLIVGAMLLLNSIVNWAGIRKPLIHAVFMNLFGLNIPIEAIP